MNEDEQYKKTLLSSLLRAHSLTTQLTFTTPPLCRYSWQKGENCYQNKEISATASSGGDTINTETAATPVTTTEATSAAEEAPAPAPALPSFFYPLDLSIGACSNDSSNRPSSFDSLGFTLFLTAEQCCDTW